MVGAAALVAMLPTAQRNLPLRTLDRILVPLLILEIVLGSASGRLFEHYFQPATLVGGFTICAMFYRMRDVVTTQASLFRSQLRTVGMGCLYLALVAPCFVWFAEANGAVLTKGLWFNQPVLDVRNYLKQHESSGNIFVWGNRPGIYLTPGVSKDVRFSFVLPFLIANYVTNELVHKLLDDLTRRRPEIIFDLSPSETVPPLSGFVLGPVSGLPSWETWRVTPPLAAFYNYGYRNYSMEQGPKAQGFIVYRRLDAR
ncbi:MAG: hypothetical protein JOY71_20430 [Acetobacteraceae bacterium]|nr:hypothetical protein [Acetobacteraceae bacterium]